MQNRSKLRERTRQALMEIAVLAISSAGVNASSFSWSNSGGGNWNVAGNWSPTLNAPPGGADTAAFGLVNSYSVILNTSPVVTTITVSGSNVTFSGNTTGRTLSSSTMFVNSGSLTLNSAADPVTLMTTNTTNFNTAVNISNGNKVSVTGVGMGIAAASSSTTTVDGMGSNLTSSSTNISTPTSVATTGVLTFSNSATGSLGNVNLATSGTSNGTLNVQTGAAVTTGTMSLATSGVMGQVAAVTVTGSGSSLSTGSFTVGSSTNSSGTVTISNIATMNTNGNIMVNANGEIDVLAGATVTFGGNLTLSGGAAGRGNLILTGTNSAADQTAGTITIGTSGAKLQINAGTTYTGGSNGTFVNSGGLIDINDGTFNANSNISVFAGTLQKSSAGTFTWASGKLMLVQGGGMVKLTGDYTIPASASITVSGSGSTFSQLTSGGLTIVPGTAMTVQSSGTLSALSLSVGATGNTNALLTIDGSGTTASATSLTVGSGSVSSGTVNLTNSGAMTIASGGLITVNTGGWINIDGGTLNANGDINLNGGILAQTSTAGGAFDWAAAHTMNIQSGGQLSVFGSYITPNNSTINLTGATSQLNSSGATGGFNVANFSTLNISNGASVTVANIMSVDFRSAINFSSGMMTVGDLRTLGNPTHFNWSSGTLNVTGAGGVELGSVAEFGSSLSVTPTSVLNITNTLTIDAAAKLQAFGPASMGALANSGELDAIGTTVNVTAASTNVSGGKISLIGSTLNLGSGANQLTNTGRINLIDSTVNGDIKSSAGGVINPAGDVTFNGSITGGASLLQISDGKTAIGLDGNRVVAVASLSLGGNLDLTNNKLVVAGGSLGAWNGTNYTGITGSIKSGRNGGAWNGSGIVTSQSDAVGAAAITTIGVALAGDIGKTSLGDASVNPGDVLAMYTYAGDANLSGKIDGDDYFRIDSGFTAHSTGYENGDFNFDGRIDADDYFLIDRNYASQGSAFRPGAPIDGVTPVPESGAFMLISLALPAFIGRRRRHNLLAFSRPN